MPLISEGRAIGALTVSDDTPGRRFTEDDAQTLSLFAQQAALILEGARRRQQERELALNAERTRLARDLHDGLAQDLAALLLRADACQSLLGEGDEALRDQLEAISVGLQQAIRDARATILCVAGKRNGGLQPGGWSARPGRALRGADRRVGQLLGDRRRLSAALP